MSTPSEPQDRPTPDGPDAPRSGEAGDTPAPEPAPQPGPESAGPESAGPESAGQEPAGQEPAPYSPPPQTWQSGPPPGWNVPYNSTGPSTGRYAQYPQNPYGPGAGGWQNPPQPHQPQTYQPQTYQPQPHQPQTPPPPNPPGYGTDVYGGWSPPSPAPEAEPAAVRRPGSVLAATIVLIVAALPFLVGGITAMTVPLTQDLFPPEVGLDALLAQSGLTFDQLVEGLRVLFALVALMAVAYIAFALVAFTGRNWGRIAVTVLTALFAVVMLLNAPGLLGSPLTLLVVLAPVVLGIVGVILLRGAPASAWFAARRETRRR
ncbi:MAG: hypothetical protein OJJ54_20115 [Pseudonocardia sp.]|nr:hypothetical protein [Pseudonocardia sp.]